MLGDIFIIITLHWLDTGLPTLRYKTSSSAIPYTRYQRQVSNNRSLGRWNNT